MNFPVGRTNQNIIQIMTTIEAMDAEMGSEEDANSAEGEDEEMPQPLVEQLADGGKLVIPLGGMDEQELVMFTRRGSELVRKSILPVRFVPLLGMHGWREGSGPGGTSGE